ncbi:MAG TPA: hypothetical protein VGS06_26515 [Streptosporangiaceae bacterium]|nr:hypothetical protein [Streptosporangiaceae bacterium]
MLTVFTDTDTDSSAAISCRLLVTQLAAGYPGPVSGARITRIQ